MQSNFAQRQGLAMWRYSVLRLPGLLLSKDMKMKIYSKAELYSAVGYIAEQRYIDQYIFVKPPYSQTHCWLQGFCHLNLSTE